jgi:nicotinamidase-related amidase
MENSALLIIDVQNDYFAGGRMELPDSDRAAGRIKLILDKFRQKNLPVIHVQHESLKEGSTFFLPGTDGQKIRGLLEPQSGEKVVVKHFPNSFLKTELQSYLDKNDIKRLIITGMMTFMCVDATTRAAKDLGYECLLVHDCTATPAVEFAGVSCSAEQAKAAISGALALICDEVVSAAELMEMV